MERGQGSSFILLEAHQKPVRISQCCAELCKTDVLERKFKASCPVPDPTGHPLLAASSQQRACFPFFQETSQGDHVSLDVEEQRRGVGSLLSLCSGLCLAGSTAGLMSPLGRWSLPSPGNGTGTAAELCLPCCDLSPGWACAPSHLSGLPSPEAFDPTTAYKQGGLQTARAGARQGLLFLECYSGLRNICLCEGPGLGHVCASRRD